jgi:drug/metabolite transporter (DMT)-like permease
MLPLFLTILCSTSIALILKHSDTKQGEPIVLLAGNYLTAGVIGLLLMLLKDTSYSVETFIFGALLGLLFVASFFAFAKAVAAAGTALATISSRLSVIIPIVFSIILFDEEPSAFKLFGFLFTGITFVLFYFSLLKQSNSSNKKGKYYLLLFVLISIGINDFSLKVFKDTRPETDEPFFVLIIFFFAFIYSMLFIVLKKIRIDKTTFITGVGLGVPNVFSTIFLLAALSQLPAILVYPAINIGIILFTAIGAYTLWREGMNKPGIAALISGVLAILFLSINSG